MPVQRVMFALSTLRGRREDVEDDDDIRLFLLSLLLSPKFWMIAQQLAGVLFQCRIVTKYLQGEAYPTISYIWPLIERLKANLQENAGLLVQSKNTDKFDVPVPPSEIHPTVQLARRRLLNNLNDRFSTPLDNDLIAMMLDPRLIVYTALGDPNTPGTLSLFFRQKGTRLVLKCVEEIKERMESLLAVDKKDEENASYADEEEMSDSDSDEGGIKMSVSQDSNQKDNRTELEQYQHWDPCNTPRRIFVPYVMNGELRTKRTSGGGSKIEVDYNPIALWNSPWAKMNLKHLRILALAVLSCPAAQSFSERGFSSTSIMSKGNRSSTGADTLEAQFIVRHSFMLLGDQGLDGFETPPTPSGSLSSSKTPSLYYEEEHGNSDEEEQDEKQEQPSTKKIKTSELRTKN